MLFREDREPQVGSLDIPIGVILLVISEEWRMLWESTMIVLV